MQIAETFSGCMFTSFSGVLVDEYRTALNFEA